MHAIVFCDDLLTPAVILIWVLSVQVTQLYIKLLEYNLKVFVYIIMVAIKMMKVLFVDKCTRNLSCRHFDWMLQSNQNIAKIKFLYGCLQRESSPLIFMTAGATENINLNIIVAVQL